MPSAASLAFAIFLSFEKHIIFAGWLNPDGDKLCQSK
jgi:hypothetical protein